ncbi:MAG: FAD-dependent oxidoreductase [Firmicutes bacterium]|jgi:NADPH-dependent glutamate synthase beta subunit-like oxidoreductase|nr:FAD-dependent oxidoreductase [Bacillota bacterium]
MLYKDLERRIIASPPGLCPVDMAASFLKLCHAQTCGKCTPCRIGLAQLGNLLDDVLSGNADMDTLQLIEDTAQTIYDTADCAIGYEAAEMVLNGVRGFRDDYIEHIQHNRCTATLNQPVPCVSQCPAHVDIPGYVALVGHGRYDDAVRLIRQDNPFVTTCAFICEHPCENRCRRNMLDDSVNIRGIKRFAADHISNDYVPELAEPTGKKVAVIGGGPGGLSAAYYLAIMGHDVTVYEQREKLGGMLRYGIPAYRLPRERLDDEIKHILSTGIKVKTNVSIGKDMPISQIQKKYDAIYIAIGAHIDKKIGIEGEDSKNVMSAVEMLRAIGDDNYPDFKGKNVVVIGGGNVAMDVVRSSVRLGAKKVTCVYRRRQEDMTALAEEVEGAIAEGVVMETLKAPARIEADKDGKAVALWVKPQIISKVKNGRPAPADSKLPEERIPADLIIVSIGQGIESHEFEKAGIPVKRGNFEAMDLGGVGVSEGLFAGGDCVTGPATVIRAIAAGKVAAANIDEYLGFKHTISHNVEIPEPRHVDQDPCGRVEMHERDPQERKCDFQCIEDGMTEEEMLQETSRCLRCDRYGYGVFKGGRLREW